MQLRFTIPLLTSLLCAGAAFAGDEDLQSVIDDAKTVDEAVARIIDVVEGQGYTIPLVVNHAAAAQSVGLTLRPTQVIFARPPRFLEKGLLRRGDTAGIDLPVKFLVFEDEDGDIELRYNDIGYLVDRHDLPVTDFLLWLLRSGTGQFGDLDDGLVTVPSNQSIDDTVDSLLEAISANGAFRIPLVLELDGPGREDPVLIVFGNPNAGTPLMQATQEVALDLPQKYLVWKRRRGEVVITYNDPFFVGKRANVQGQDARLGAIAAALANFAAAGAGAP